MAAVKGAILSTIKNPKIIDISHQIEPYNVTQAAYVLKMPTKLSQGSIHIVGVESERHQRMVI